MATTTDQNWDAAAIRRAIQLLGSHSPSINDPQSTARALRLVWDILQRRGAPTEIFQLPGTMPLVIVPGGSTLVITHLDDPHPFAQVDVNAPPTMDGDLVTAPGITRKAGVLAALGSFLSDDSMLSSATLIIEADRHDGSSAFARWIDTTGRHFDAALCEVADMPVPAPALYLAAAGVVTVEITVHDDSGDVERLYGGVRLDLGHLLIDTLAALKSSDAEVLIPGFYDGVITPDAEGLSALHAIAAGVGAWVMRGAPATDDRLSSSHLTLGAFLAPSIVVREMKIESSGPYLARQASAVVEARIMPGQNAATIARSIADFVVQRAPGAQVDTILLRPVATGGAFDPSMLASVAPVIPVTPGNSPAGLLEAIGVPTLGFSTVWRDPSALDEVISLSSIAERSTMIQTLIPMLNGSPSDGLSSK